MPQDEKIDRELILPVVSTYKRAKTGSIWYDTTDGYLHFYDATKEVTITGCTTT